MPGPRRWCSAAVAVAAGAGRGAGVRRAVARTGTAATVGWTWRAGQVSRCTPRDRRRWYTPECWPAVGWCHWRIPAVCGPATSRSRPRVRVGQRLAAGARIGELVAGHAGCPAAAVSALGSDVGSGCPRRLRRPAGPADIDDDPAQAATRMSCAVSAITLVTPASSPCIGEKCRRARLRATTMGAVAQVAQRRAQRVPLPGTGVTAVTSELTPAGEPGRAPPAVGRR